MYQIDIFWPYCQGTVVRITDESSEYKDEYGEVQDCRWDETRRHWWVKVLVNNSESFAVVHPSLLSSRNGEPFKVNIKGYPPINIRPYFKATGEYLYFSSWRLILEKLKELGHPQLQDCLFEPQLEQGYDPFYTYPKFEEHWNNAVDLRLRVIK